MQIRNKRLDYVRGVHATTIEVSSTDSPMYWNIKKNDYATRASFEALKYVGVDGKKGGTLIFVLLTYNKEHLPMFPYSSVPCFNMRHVSTLVKALKDKYGRSTFSYLVGLTIVFSTTSFVTSIYVKGTISNNFLNTTTKDTLI